MKKLVISLTLITSASLLAPVFEIENREASQATVKVYGGELDEVQITNAQPLGEATIDGNQHEMISVPEQEQNSYTIFAIYPSAPSGHMGGIGPNPFHIQNTRPTEQLTIRNSLRGIARTTQLPQLPSAAAPAAPAVPILHDPKTLTDAQIDAEWASITSSPASSDAIEQRLYDLKAERARRKNIEKRIEILNEKYYAQGLTDEEKKEVLSIQPNFLVPALFYYDVHSKRNEMMLAPEAIRLMRSPLSTLSDEDLMKARVFIDTARKEKREAELVPAGRAFDLSQEIGRRRESSPEKNKELDQIHLKLLGLGEPEELSQEQQKKTLLLLQKNLTDFKKQVVATTTLETEISEKIAKQGFEKYFAENLAPNSKGRNELENSEFDAFIHNALAANGKIVFDAQAIGAITVYTILNASKSLTFETISTLKERLLAEIIDIIECVNKRVNNLPCDVKTTNIPYEEIKTSLEKTFQKFLNFIDHGPQKTLEQQLKKAYTVKFNELLLNVINDAFFKEFNAVGYDNSSSETLPAESPGLELL